MNNNNGVNEESDDFNLYDLLCPSQDFNFKRILNNTMNQILRDKKVNKDSQDPCLLTVSYVKPLKTKDALNNEQRKRYEYIVKNSHFSNCFTSAFFCVFRSQFATLPARHWLTTYYLLELITKGYNVVPIKKEPTDDTESINKLEYHSQYETDNKMNQELLEKFRILEKINTLIEISNGSFMAFVTDYYDTSQSLIKLLEGNFTKAYQTRRSAFYFLFFESSDKYDFFKNEHNRNIPKHNPILFKFITRFYTLCQLLGFYKSSQSDEFFFSIIGQHYNSDNSCLVDIADDTKNGAYNHSDGNPLVTLKMLLMNGVIEVLCRYYLVISEILLILINNNIRDNNNNINESDHIKYIYIIDCLAYYNELMKGILMINCTEHSPGIVYSMMTTVKSWLGYEKMTNKNLFFLTYTHPIYLEGSQKIKVDEAFVNFRRYRNELKHALSHSFIRTLTFRFLLIIINDIFVAKDIPIDFAPKFGILFMLDDYIQDHIDNLNYSRYLNLNKNFDENTKKKENNDDGYDEIKKHFLNMTNEEIYNTDIAESDCNHLFSFYPGIVTLQLIFNKQDFVGQLKNNIRNSLEKINTYIGVNLITIRSIMMAFADTGINTIPLKLLYDYLQWLTKIVNSNLKKRIETESKLIGLIKCLSEIKDILITADNHIRDLINVQLNEKQTNTGRIYAKHDAKNTSIYKFNGMKFTDILKDYNWELTPTLLIEIDKVEETNSQLEFNQILPELSNVKSYIEKLPFLKQTPNSPVIIIDIDDKYKTYENLNHEAHLRTFIMENVRNKKINNSNNNNNNNKLNSPVITEQSMVIVKLEFDSDTSPNNTRPHDMPPLTKGTASDLSIIERNKKLNTNNDSNAIVQFTNEKNETYSLKTSKILMAYSNQKGVFLAYIIDIYHVETKSDFTDLIDSHQYKIVINITPLPCMTSVRGSVPTYHNEVRKAIDKIMFDVRKTNLQQYVYNVNIVCENPTYIVNDLDEYTQSLGTDIKQLIFNRFTYIYWIIECIKGGLSIKLLLSQEFLKLFGRSIDKHIFGEYQKKIRNLIIATFREKKKHS